MILISGPCVIESTEIMEEIAEVMSSIAKELGLKYYFKASFDKANRSSIHSYRGPGIDSGMRILSDLKEKFGFGICTDIHEPYHADAVKDIADIIQVPAFLCRQTDLLVAAGKTQRIVNVKKGQFLAPWDMINVVKKIESTDNHNIMLCERGTSFGYNRLIVDMTSIYELKKMSYPVIFDATHSVQKPGGNGETTGGSPQYIPTLINAAVASGADGLFLEVHPNPEAALSDGANSIKLSEVKGILERALMIERTVRSFGVDNP